MSSNQKTDKFCRLSNPLFLGGFVTLAFFALIAWLGFQKTCYFDVNLVSQCTNNFQKFANSPPNEVGDTLAGIAGSLAFLWIIVTVLLQSQELAAQRKELRLTRRAMESQNHVLGRQLFENTFFSMLNTLNEIINSIDLINSENEQITSGRDCFRVFYTRLTRIYRNAVGTEKRKLDYSYCKFWKDHQSELGHYFRYLYRAFIILSESEHTEEYHVKLLRSQLSNQELLLLFYNCLSENGEKFKILAENFELFDNMPAYMLLNENHHKLVSEKAFGQNSMSKPKRQVKPIVDKT